jgi:chemotaxis protein MotB
MARMLKWLSLATLAGSLTAPLVGCVPQEKYEAVVAEDEAKDSQLADLQANAQANAETANSYKAQLSTLSSQLETQSAIRTNLEEQNKALAEKAAALEANLKAAVDNDSQPKIIEAPAPEPVMVANPLPEPLTNALSEFANSNPELVDFDAARGVVKFKSDVTFATGSADLTPDAKDVISKFAQILDTSAAEGYELNVAGHTDNVPVTNIETIRRGDRDNWFLSEHRAISVAEELISHGVMKSRLAVVGYADQRPIADNSTSAGRRMNRRVEVLILPTKHVGGAVAEATGETPHHRTARSHAAAPELNKDSADSLDLNK